MLYHRHVLVSRGMVDSIHTVTLDDASDAWLINHRTEHRDHLHTAGFQLFRERIETEFVLLKQDQRTG